MMAANSSINATSMKRRVLISQRGIITSRMLCSASTGPLQRSVYVFQRQDGMPGPAWTIALGA